MLPSSPHTSRTGSASAAPRRLRPELLAAALALAGCGGGEPEDRADRGAEASTEEPGEQLSPGERTHRAMVQAASEPRHPADAGGRAWLELPEGEDGAVQASRPGRWTIVYEAGELGVAAGGGIYLQVSPFWGWSSPQPDYPDGPGYTEVSTAAEGITLVPRQLDEQLMGIEVRGRALAAGERVRIDYGAGTLGARADSYAERDSRFWIAVDGDGDGVRGVLPDSPGVPVLPGPPALLVVTLTSTARPGEPVRLTAAVLDPRASAGPEVEGTVELLDAPAGLELPASLELGPEDGARRTVEGRVTETGVYRVRARLDLGERVLEATSNPLLVTGGGPHIRWADLHGHSAVSDGTGSPEDYFRYARDVAGLDAVALTDHDHWGLLFMDEHPELWELVKREGQRFHDPGRFVTLHGYEWTSWVYGHRHVLFFSEEAPLLSSLDEAYDTPAELWEALRGLDALTVPHHPAGGPVAIDWSVRPDPELEPNVEVTSAHGCSEARDCRPSIYSAVEGAYARDALVRGYELGFIASGDSHDGHPGLTHLGPHYPTGGVAAVLADELTRPGLLAALRARRAYATSGPRIVLRTALGTAPMGASIPAAELGASPMLYVEAYGTAEILGVEVVRSGELVAGLAGEGSQDFAAAATLDALKPGEHVYVRVLQVDGGTAWSSPIFVE